MSTPITTTDSRCRSRSSAVSPSPRHPPSAGSWTHSTSASATSSTPRNARRAGRPFTAGWSPSYRQRGMNCTPRASRSPVTYLKAAASPPPPHWKLHSHSHCSAWPSNHRRRTCANSPSSARGSRTSGSAPRPVCWISSPACCHDPATRCGSTSAASMSKRSRSSSVTGNSSRVDSGATHSHAGSGYNERRAECRAACEALGIETPARRERPGSQRSTARCCAARGTSSPRTSAWTTPRRPSTPDDLETVGELLDASHASLRDDYEASVPEVEATVERLKAAGAAGARMVGGGFGGSVLALLPPGVPRPAAALAVTPGAPARLL